jgi:hypothetical protein
MTDQESLQRYLLTAIASVVPPHGGAYVGGPLATGKEYYELLASGDELAASRIREGNERKMRLFVQSLRAKLRHPVIDPGLLKIERWTSREIGDFYIKVIEEFAAEVWFMEGWEYSRGATREFIFAVSRRIRCLDSSGVEISAKHGSRLIAKVVDHLREMGLDASRFVERISKIENL